MDGGYGNMNIKGTTASSLLDSAAIGLSQSSFSFNLCFFISNALTHNYTFPEGVFTSTYVVMVTHPHTVHV